MNEIEQRFQDEAVKMGYRVYRNGFPDFLLVNPNDPKDIIFAEVKRQTSYCSLGFSEAQVKMFRSLRNAGHKVIVSIDGDLTKVPDPNTPRFDERTTREFVDVIKEVLPKLEVRLRVLEHENEQLKGDNEKLEARLQRLGSFEDTNKDAKIRNLRNQLEELTAKKSNLNPDTQA